ncbi:BREX-2 system adenine-specific DNA-methyltransferase PglX [Micromonospora sp. WMMC264]|uniref:BREX-2 system adenine-specific DNA-methyltransferase PglX n=1 Tax=Micromonospora sp. WMMC264 TaxID=3015158 RepID=UPI00248AA8BB|nr:BREX-2 system adenine-specific DNA-methyltransferase PglX [Micromonospora sp. WMMC264]WBB83539.1 BREX-2 system adenine-specific DNA-methyltransferase PglX [Micromonospora sp. WMMC264]
MIPLKALQTQVTALTDDLRGRVTADSELESSLRKEHAQATEARRTAGTFETWLEDVLDQAAVAWVLGCVFVRFCEDNELVEPLWIGGPEPVAPAGRAMQHRQQHLIDNPRHNDRHWLREAFTYLRGLRATGKIFDEHNPVWRFDISGAAAEKLSEFFRRGPGLVSLRVDDLNTRFLGDLYQDLSTHAKKTYALLQTPEFVEEFILDRTFEPAVREFGLPETSVIDPTCGSGHFLLGAFGRLVRKWREREPATDIRVLVERALGQVTGVDINPFAVAIARFRLLIAAMKECDLRSLERTPSWPVRVATGDSLLQWGRKSRHQGDLIAMLEGQNAFAYATEDADVLADYLREGQYTVVVGNPPYITVADAARNRLYRKIYETCSGKYALTVPFAERFFQLAKRGDEVGMNAGHVGQITGNGFMKREFGRNLITQFFSEMVDLAEVIDTSGAYIPGHGTPTVIVVGLNRLASRRYSGRIRAVLGIRGEPSVPNPPSSGRVWKAIAGQIDNPGSESAWVTVLDLDRQRLATHPWSLSGGQSPALMAHIDKVRTAPLSDVIASAGITSFTLGDDLYIQPAGTFARGAVPSEYTRPMVVGEDIRDWGLQASEFAAFPYDEDLRPVDPSGGLLRFLWPGKAHLSNSRMFGNKSKVEAGLRWTEYGRLTVAKLKVPHSIALAFVSTHNQFVLDRGGKVFKQTAPVLKLPQGATEDEHLRLLGLLNSSTACFWLKQVSHNKGSTVDQRGARQTTIAWENFYEFTGTKLQEFPLPAAYPLERARLLDSLAQRLAGLTPAAVAGSGVPTRERLAAAQADYDDTRARMIALQEELDWEVYRLYGLRDDDLTCAEPPRLKLGERAFEIVLARKGAEPEWFARHGSTPITELPAHWPDDYRALVQRRIEAIESDRNIALIERPECKRRWATEGWDAMQAKALRDWLLDRLEAPELWGDRPIPQSVAQLADGVRHDDDFRAVLELWTGRDDYDLTKTLAKLVADEHVPFLPAYRYKPSGLRKRAQWERTWAQQRLEDAGEDVDIKVPPKYTSADFAKTSYWRARGKLDVPKERFISYPKAGRDGDGTELLGWAGWDHLAQAQALATVYLDRNLQAAWPAERLLPLLAGIAELEPWLHQWHTEERPDFPGIPAQFFTDLIDTELSQLGADRPALLTLRGLGGHAGNRGE